MNIQEAMKQMNDVRKAGHQGMRIKEILAVLDAAPDNIQVIFDFEYLAPDGFISYRGYYEDLAIMFNDKKAPSCEQFRNDLRNCIGKEFYGYKGGDYTMGEDTLVWVANSGNTGGTAVVRVTFNNYEVVLHTAKIDD